MKLSDEEVKAIKDRADRIWSHNEIIGNNHTTCSSCLQVRLCISDIATGQSTCKECYVEKSIAEAERKKQVANLMPDFAKL